MAHGRPPFIRKKPSGVRSPVRNSRSRSSTSLVRSLALSASVPAAVRSVGLALLHGLGVLDLIRAEERLVDAAHDAWNTVRGIEALVGIGLPRKVGVGRDLPAAEIDRLKARLHLLHRLVSGEGAQSRHVI